jgi:hypothetical protein
VIAQTAVRVLPRLRPYQQEAGRSIVASVSERRALSFTVVMARQAGKNELSAQLELHLLMQNARLSVDAVKCAPTFEPQARISMQRLWARVIQAGVGAIASRESHAIRIGAARQLFLSAEPSANVLGHTAGLLMEVDEAQEVDIEKFEREFRPMCASTGATIVFYGTPWDDSSLLERAVQAGLEAERRDGVRRHFRADWTAVARYNPAYGRFVEAERARLGEEHPLFRTQYALKTVTGGGRLLTAGQRAQLEGRHPRQAAPREGETYVGGLDIGGQRFEDGPPSAAYGSARQDATVLTIARVAPRPSGLLPQEPLLEIVDHLALTGEAHDVLFARLADVLGRVWNVRRLAIDASGLGETLARLLSRALGQGVVKALRFSQESKSRLGYELLAAINSGRLRMYAADGSREYADFWREMELARAAYRPNRTMNFYVEASQGHDDYLISLALAVEAAQELDTRARIARGRLPEPV